MTYVRQFCVLHIDTLLLLLLNGLQMPLDSFLKLFFFVLFMRYVSGLCFNLLLLSRIFTQLFLVLLSDKSLEVFFPIELSCKCASLKPTIISCLY